MKNIIIILVLFVALRNSNGSESWLSAGYPASWSDTTVLANFLDKPPEAVNRIFSARILVSAKKAHITKHGSFNKPSYYQEAIVLCDAEISASGRTNLLLYIRRSLDSKKMIALRVWHTSMITPKINMYAKVNIDTVTSFIKETNFGMNECDPNMYLQTISIKDLDLVSFRKMQNNIPTADVLQARLEEYRDSYMESFEGYNVESPEKKKASENQKKEEKKVLTESIDKNR